MASRPKGSHGLYREGEKINTVTVTDPILPARGFTAAEEPLTKHAERYIEGFEEGHPTDR